MGRGKEKVYKSSKPHSTQHRWDSSFDAETWCIPPYYRTSEIGCISYVSINDDWVEEHEKKKKRRSNQPTEDAAKVRRTCPSDEDGEIHRWSDLMMLEQSSLNRIIPSQVPSREYIDWEDVFMTGEGVCQGRPSTCCDHGSCWWCTCDDTDVMRVYDDGDCGRGISVKQQGIAVSPTCNDGGKEDEDPDAKNRYVLRRVQYTQNHQQAMHTPALPCTSSVCGPVAILKAQKSFVAGAILGGPENEGYVTSGNQVIHGFEPNSSTYAVPSCGMESSEAKEVVYSTRKGTKDAATQTVKSALGCTIAKDGVAGRQRPFKVIYCDQNIIPSFYVMHANKEDINDMYHEM